VSDLAEILKRYYIAVIPGDFYDQDEPYLRDKKSHWRHRAVLDPKTGAVARYEISKEVLEEGDRIIMPLARL